MSRSSSATDCASSQAAKRAGSSSSGKPRTSLHVAVAHAEAAPRLEQARLDAVRAAPVRREREAAGEAAGRAAAAEDDDVARADRVAAGVRVLGPAFHRHVPGCHDRVDRRGRSARTRGALAGVSQPGVEDQRVARPELLADLATPLSPVAVGQVPEVGVRVRLDAAEPLGKRAAELLDGGRPALEGCGVAPEDGLWLRDRDVRRTLLCGRPARSRPPTSVPSAPTRTSSALTRSRGRLGKRVELVGGRVPGAGGDVRPHLRGRRRACDHRGDPVDRGEPADRGLEQARPRAAAADSRASTVSRRSSVRLSLRPERRDPSGAGSPRRYLPVSSPLSSGKKGTYPIPCSRQSGRTPFVVAAMHEAVAVLDRDDGHAGRERLLELRRADVREPEPASLALVDELLHRAERLGERRLAVGAVVVVEVDDVGAEPCERELDRPPEVRGASRPGRGLPRPGRTSSRSRTGRAGPRRLSDELLACPEP